MEMQRTDTAVSPVHRGTEVSDSDDDDGVPAPVELNGDSTIDDLALPDPLQSIGLDEWIINYGMLADHDLEHHGKTFVDDDGAVRFTDNWQLAPPSHRCSTYKSISSELSLTGCLNIPVQVRASAAGSSSKSAKSAVRNISFLTNFRALWDYLNNDNMDELTSFAPLFRMYLNLFFHQRTIQMVVLLGVYELLWETACDIFYKSLPFSIVLLSYFTIIFEVTFYLALVILYKGTIRPQNRPDLTNTDGTDDKTAHQKEQRKYSLHWCASARQVVDHSWRELQSFYRRRRRGGVLSAAAPQTVPFYDLLNISLKFLVRHSNNINDKLRLSSRSHTGKLLFILFLLPLYFIVVTYVPPSSPYQLMADFCDDNSRSAKCYSMRMLFYSTLGFATRILRKYIFCSAVLLSLLGLSYGAEIAHCLTDSWLNRFVPLRRLPLPTSADEESQTDESSPALVPAVAAAVASDSRKLSSPRRSTPREDKTKVPGESSIQGSGPEKLLLANGARSANKVAPAVAPDDALFPPVKVADVVPHLQRDAYEHYLFIREYMAIAGRLWSPTIVTFFFFAVFVALTFFFLSQYYAQYNTPVDWAYFAIGTFIRLCILVVYPIMALAHANAYVYALQEQFLGAAPEDFVVLGGRDGWLDYLEKVPATWTIYGVWVTWDRLTGMLWTCVAALGATVISIASASAAVS